MTTEEGLFGNYKYCEYCKRALPIHFEPNLCPKCQDADLFRQVKEFIRANIVNEYEVATHFHIPLKQVKEWIREGRIEYREEETAKTVVGLRCMHCGAPVSFGSLCSKCLKQMNGNKGFSSENASSDDNRMRFLDSKDNS